MTREQLRTLSDLVSIAHDEYDGCPGYRDDLERYDRLLAEIKAEAQPALGNRPAIAVPARNCDVGTAEEQHKRFNAFCEGHPTCAGCPFDFTDDITACPIEWSQMPFAPPKGGRP